MNRSKILALCLLVAVCFGSSDDVLAKGKKRASCIVFSKKALKFEESIQREGWELVWHDEFDGKALSNAWTRIPRFPNPSEWDKFMSSDDRLYKVKGGVLTLYGLVNDFLPEDTAHFLTGGVYTKGKVYFQRGRVDVRLKTDDASGAWPAAWLLPAGMLVMADGRAYCRSSRWPRTLFLCGLPGVSLCLAFLLRSW